MSQSIKKSVYIIIVVSLAIIVALKYCPRFIPSSHTIELLNTTGISDGPYVFLKGEEANIKWISNDSLHIQNISTSEYIHIGGTINHDFHLNHLVALTTNQSSEESGVDKLAVLSDIHGQYNLFIDLLKANHIVDKQGNWRYKKGHLVIIGDAFDRGDKVTETLWHILKLSEQANKEGGQVHYLLGNHDIMVLNADLRYINKKYNAVEETTGDSYHQLFGKNTLMGQWLRSCPVVLKINDIVFNHAGLSMAMVDNNININDINQTFADNIIDNNRDSIRANEHLSLLARSQGPIWYRGYFKDTTLTNASIDSILLHFDAKHIVVGHTSMEQIEVLFDKRILAADTSIKKGENGQLLIIEGKRFYRSGLDGKKQLLW